MRRVIRLAALAALAGAIADLKAPWRTGPRTRVYVVDVSGSMLASGAPESLTVEDAFRLVAFDVQSSRADDLSALILAGAKPVLVTPPCARDAFPTPVRRGDPSGTDLDGALAQAAALAGDGDILLLSDGRAPVSPRPALIHVIASGPIDPVDARIAAVDLPPFVRPGTGYTARVTVAATAALRTTLLGREVVFEGPGVQDFIIEGLRGVVDATLDTDDACPGNNSVRLQVLERDEKPRLLLITDAPLPLDGDRGRDPTGYDVIVLNNVAAKLSAREIDRLAAAVRGGAGLLILGGSRSYARGGWAGTPLEEISPLWCFPDERVALVVVIDRSGSMAQDVAGRRKIDILTSAVSDALSLLKDDDEIAAVPFSGEPTAIPIRPGAKRGEIAETLRRLDPNGPTMIAPALKKALDVLEGATAGKRRILLLTDGETEESADDLKAVASRLGSVGLTIVGTAGTRGKLEALGGEFFGVTDLDKFSLGEAIARSRDLELMPASVDAGWPIPTRVNRTTAKTAAEVVARAGGAPLVALQGRVAACTFALEEGWAGGFATWSGLGDLVRRVTPTGAATAHVSFDGDVLIIRASAAGTALVDDQPVLLVQRGSQAWEGRHRVIAGTHSVRIGGRVVASAVLPCSPELASLGVDLPALDRIGKRVLTLQSLPERRAMPASLPLRPLLLIAALLLFLGDIALATFWKR